MHISSQSNHKAPKTDGLPSFPVTPQSAEWSKEVQKKAAEIKRDRDAALLQRISGPGLPYFQDEDAEDTDPAIEEVETVKISIPKLSRFVGIGQTGLRLCRSGFRDHCNKYKGAFPERQRVSLETYNNLKRDIANIYGVDFDGRLPLPYALPCTLHSSKTVSVEIDNSLDNDTVICVH